MIRIEIQGKKIKYDLDAELEINDVSQEQSTVAAKMAYWASLWASAEAEKIEVDAYYRKWRAEFGRKLLENDPKMSEWKVKQAIESQENFSTLKKAIAIAAQNAQLCRGIYESFRIKANALQSKGAMLRAELDATGMNTPENSGTRKKRKTTSKENDEAVSKMKKLNKKKKNQKN